MIPANSRYIKRPELLSMKLAVNSRCIKFFVMKWGGFNYCLNFFSCVKEQKIVVNKMKSYDVRKSANLKLYIKIYVF